MSTSLLYHGFGIQGYHYVWTTYNDGQVIFSIKPVPFSLCCPICGSKDLKRRGTITRMFKTVPIGTKAVFIQLPVQRVQCLCCNAIRQAKKPFAQLVQKLHKCIRTVCFGVIPAYGHFCCCQTSGISWGVIKDIQKRYLSNTTWGQVYFGGQGVKSTLDS